MERLARLRPPSAARWAVAIVAIVVVTRLPALIVTFFNEDEATYSALGARIAAGFAPYTGAIDHKPPGIALLYALIYWVAGAYNLLAVRLVLLAAVALTAIVLGQLAAERRGEPARIAGVAYAVVSALGMPDDAQAANTELFAALPLALAALAVTRGGARRLFAAGVLVGLATLLRYQSALVGGALAITVVLESPARRTLIALAAGFAAVALGFLASLAALGALEPYWFWGWGYNFIYLAVLSPGERVINALAHTLFTALWWIPLFAVLRRPRGALELAWLVAALVGVAPGGRFFLHYYLAVLAPLALCADLARIRPRAVLAAGLAVALALGLAFGKYHYEARHAAEDREYRAIAREVDARTRPGDRIFVWGASPEIYHHADRVMATRFAFCNYHTGRVWGSRYVDADATDTEAYIVPRAMAELLADLAAAPPALIIDGGAGKLNRFDRHPIARYPELASWLAAHYRLAAIVAGVPIYALD